MAFRTAFEAVPIDYGSVQLDYELVRVQIACTDDSEAQTLVSKAPDGFRGVSAAISAWKGPKTVSKGSNTMRTLADRQ
jgi:hypothetical protein